MTEGRMSTKGTPAPGGGAALLASHCGMYGAGLAAGPTLASECVSLLAMDDAFVMTKLTYSGTHMHQMK